VSTYVWALGDSAPHVLLSPLGSTLDKNRVDRGSDSDSGNRCQQGGSDSGEGPRARCRRQSVPLQEIILESSEPWARRPLF
jgi:hypothetical protein